MENAPQGHLHFGPVVLANQPESVSGGGLWTEAGVSYGPGSYDISLVIQNIDVDTGVPFFGGAAPEMGIDGTIIDLAYSRDIMLGNMDFAWSAGLRYVEFTTMTDNFSAGNGPVHDFSGTGVRIGADTGGEIGAVQGLSWSGAAGLSLVPGTIESSGRGAWFFSDATPTDVTAFGADLRLAAQYELTSGLDLVGGYQAQLWQDVTVATSDNTGVGGNEGSSDLLIHGLFLGLHARW